LNDSLNYSVSNSNLLFSKNALKWIIITSSFFPLIIGILSIIGGISVFIISLVCFLLLLPLVYYCKRLININGLYLAFIFSITLKLFFLLIKLIVQYQDPNMAVMIGGDSINYHDDIYEQNITQLLLTYGVDITFVYYLKFLASTFNILQTQVPIIFVIPNIFASAFFIIFSLMIAKSLFPSKYVKYIFWVSVLDPLLMVYSTVIMKDVIISFMISFSFVLFIKFKKNINRSFQFILWSLSSLIAFFFRWRALGIISGFVSLRIIFSNKISLVNKTFIVLFISISFMLFSIVSGKTINVLRVINKNKSIVSTEKDIRSAVNTSNQEDSRNAGRLGTIINNINSFPIRTVARSAMSFLAPIPPMQFYQFEWGKDINSRQARIFKDLVGFYWYSIMPLFLLGFINFIKSKDYFYPLSFLLVIFAMGMSGWVDARIRLMAIIPTYIFISEGLINYPFWNRFSLSFYFTLLLLWSMYELVF
jgi:hypothetical protein